MNIMQISVFLENKVGRLSEVTSLLAENEIDLKALSISETHDFGILRLIVDDFDKAQKVLTDGQYICKTTKVIGVKLEDKPGGMAEVLKVFAEYGISIEYAYAFISHNTANAYMICKVANEDEAIQKLQQAGINIACKNDIF